MATMSDDWVSLRHLSASRHQTEVMNLGEDPEIEHAVAEPAQELQRSGWGMLLGDLNNLGVDVAGAAIVAGGGMIASKLHSHHEPPAEPPAPSQPGASDPEPQA
jgi:hypothetical protein